MEYCVGHMYATFWKTKVAILRLQMVCQFFSALRR